MIQLNSVVKKYGSLTALDGVSLEIENGEFFALLGPNGAGKTTIIRILLDFTRQNGGSAYINGIPCSTPQAREGVGYLPEDFRVPRFLNGLEYLKRQAALYGIQGSRAEMIIDKVIETVGLKGRERDKLGGYSKGMLQRIGLAAALICSPKLLILDEPTNGLDPIGMREFRLILENLRNEKITMLLNSHILSEVEKICTSAAIMNKGRILAKDKISNLAKENETLEDVFMRIVGSSTH